MMAPLKLQRDELIQIVTWFARGYTIRYIESQLRSRAAKAGMVDQLPTEQDLLTLAVRYSNDIEQVRSDLAKDALRAGLARKEERVRRLSESAEAIEDQVMSGMNLKATETYRKILSSIHDEVEPLHLVIISPDDPWALLLTNLKKTRDSTPTPSVKTQSTLNSPKSTSTSEQDRVPTKLEPTLTTSSTKDISGPTTDNKQS